jgi:hypothetical protein
MIWKPSRRKVVISMAFAALCVVLEWFLSAPLLDPMALGRAITMGIVAGYLLSPWLESIQYPPGYFRPTPARLGKTLVIAGVGVLLLLALQAVTHRLEFNAAGLLVTLLYIAGGVYVKLGRTPQSPAR